MELTSQKCVPCKIGAPILRGRELLNYKNSVDPLWKLYEKETKLKRDFEFKDFRAALRFINKVGEIAEEESHHPNIYLHSYKNVTIELFTHKIGGLHQNDFILASKIDLVASGKID